MLPRFRIPNRPKVSAAGMRAARMAMSVLLLAGGASAVAGAVTPTFFWGNPKPQGNELSALVFENDQTGYAVGLRGTCLSTSDGGVSWRDQTNFRAFAADLKDAILMGPGDLLAVGAAPGIFRSTDGGASWTPVANPSTAQLTSIVRVSGSILSAIGNFGEVLRSTDNGATWRTQPPPAGGLDLKNQYWRSPTDGYVLGQDVLRHTSDGGATWQIIPGTQESAVFFGGDIAFLDAMNGWIMVDFTTYRSTDGGGTWFEKNGQFGQGPIYPRRSVFVDASTRYVTTDAEGADVWETFDDGLHWTRLYNRVNTRGYTDIVSPSLGVLVAVSSDGDLIRSSDGGATWTDFTRSPGDGERQSLAAISLMPGGVGFAGGGSVWLRTTDGGESWGFAPAHPAFNQAIVIRFFGTSLGLAAGNSSGNSQVSRTTDGGASWTTFAIESGYVGDPADIDIVDSSVCYAALYGGVNVNYVYRSTDGGQSWTRRSTGIPPSVRLFAIDFVDEQTGYVGGGDFADVHIYRTTDGGGSWTPVNTSGIGSYEVQAMHWFDAQTGLVSSFMGIFRTTNGGQTWTTVQTAETAFLSFADDHVGYGCSLSDPVVSRTTDAGVSWESIETPWGMGPGAICATPDGFLCAGPSSVILGARFVDPASAGDGEASAFGRDGVAGMLGSLGAGVRVGSLPAPGGAALLLEVDASRAVDPATAPTGWIADAAGRCVADLTVCAVGSSTWRMTWNSPASRVSRGVYFAVLERGSRHASVKRILLR